jgi:hypothetical protein
MRRLALVVICVFLMLTLAACDIVFGVPQTVTIEGTVYRNGFYGDLWPINLTYTGDSYEVGSNTFRRVNCEQFDWVYSAIGGTSNGVLYCAEGQWERAQAHYADDNNFTYYCQIGNKSDYRDPEIVAIPEIDSRKFEALMAFADENSYHPFDPFGSNEDVPTRRLPFPDKDESPVLIFYKESNDGFFVSFRGHKFYAIDDRLLFVFFYDHGYGAYEELVAVDIPDTIGQYFVELQAQLKDS